MSLIVLYFLHSTSVLSFYIDVVLTLSILMETFSALLAIWAGNTSVPGEYPAQRPVTRSFDVCFDLRLNKTLRKQSWGWWFETPSLPLWRHYNTFHKCVYIAYIPIHTQTNLVIHTWLTTDDIGKKCQVSSCGQSTPRIEWFWIRGFENQRVLWNTRLLLHNPATRLCIPLK